MKAKAIYKNGYLELLEPLPIKDGSNVEVEILAVKGGLIERKIGLVKGQIKIKDDFKKDIPEDISEFIV